MTKPEWLDSSHIRPYIFARKANRPSNPGTAYQFDIFDREPLLLEPLEMNQVEFANQIIQLDRVAFDANGLLTPRWVFYDCAVMPGLISGYAAKTRSLPEVVREQLKTNDDLEWTPLSLFIAIPTPETGRWMAHNLGSMNSIVAKEHQLPGLGFLSKAFGLWFGNIHELYGVAQWSSHALKLHANYGALEVVTAYTPIHDYASSITYRLWVDTDYWRSFLNKNKLNHKFDKEFEQTGLTVESTDEKSLIRLQKKIEDNKGSYFLNPHEIRNAAPGTSLHLYKRA